MQSTYLPSLVSSPPGPARAADGIELELMASKVSVINPEFTGHAFMCIFVKFNGGIKEDCYGFYSQNGVRGYIGGPGLVDSEFSKNFERFGRIQAAISLSVTEAQRRQILSLVSEWNRKDYNLTNQQCVDFIRAVASVVGGPIPAYDATDFPADFLTKLIKLRN